MSAYYKNARPDVVRMFVRVLQECCPGVVRIIMLPNVRDGKDITGKGML